MIVNVANKIIKENHDTWALNVNSFDWGPGVYLAGLVEAYQKTKLPELHDFLTGWTQRHLEDAYNKTTVNSTAPLIMVLEMHKMEPNERAIQVCREIAQWIITKAPLTCNGALEHTVTEKNAVFNEQMWADTLFMSCIFLAKLGKYDLNPAYTDFAAKQLYLHHKYLKNAQNGLFYHGYDCEKKTHLSGICWARANAWITVSTPMILAELPQSFEGRDFILRSYEEQVSVLEKYQKPDGAFGTVLDNTDSYSETSAGAGFAAGIRKGVRMGLLDAKYLSVADKAEQYVLSQIAPDGAVNGVSGGTPIMPDEQAYLRIPVMATLYGQGLTLLMLAE